MTEAFGPGSYQRVVEWAEAPWRPVTDAPDPARPWVKAQPEAPTREPGAPDWWESEEAAAAEAMAVMGSVQRRSGVR